VGFEVDEATDFAEIARAGLHGRGGLSGLPSDCAPLDGVERFYDDLRGTPYAARFSEGIAACVIDASPYVRWQALLFFQSHPRAAGVERLEAAAASHPALFDGVAEQGSELEDMLRVRERASRKE
jgi:hypothetical protein